MPASAAAATDITSDTGGTTRRDFLCAGALVGAGLIVGGCSADRRSGDGAGVAGSAGDRDSAGAHAGPADVTIRIAPVLVELAPHRVISTVGYIGQVDADFVANDPGATLFHCHQTLHMDYGFMRLFTYA